MELSCPIPKLDFDTINIGHGSGGTLTSQLLENGVFQILQNELLDKRHDGSIFRLEGKLAFTTDSYVVSPLFFPGGNIGDLAVNGTVNDLAMCGAMPKYMSLSFILEEGFPLEIFFKIIRSIKNSCDNAGVQIVTGDTKVVEKGKGDQIFINTAGIGVVHPLAEIDVANIQSGDKIIVSGPLARHGITIMSQRNGLEFETSVTSDTRPLGNIIWNLLDCYGQAIHMLRDPTRGGLASTLNEICRNSLFGVNIAQKDIPVEEEVLGACEMLGLDPLYVANEGLFIAIVDPEIAESFAANVRDWEYGVLASCIGSIVLEHPGQVILKSAIGGHRIVNMLAGEQLPRIC